MSIFSICLWKLAQVCINYSRYFKSFVSRKRRSLTKLLFVQLPTHETLPIPGKCVWVRLSNHKVSLKKTEQQQQQKKNLFFFLEALLGCSPQSTSWETYTRSVYCWVCLRLLGFPGLLLHFLCLRKSLSRELSESCSPLSPLTGVMV